MSTPSPRRLAFLVCLMALPQTGCKQLQALLAGGAAGASTSAPTAGVTTNGLGTPFSATQASLTNGAPGNPLAASSGLFSSLLGGKQPASTSTNGGLSPGLLGQPNAGSFRTNPNAFGQPSSQQQVAGLPRVDSTGRPLAGAGVGQWFRSYATTFRPQPIAGKTVEDGDSQLEAGERGVALPSRAGLGKWVELRYNGQVAYAPVIDVGPWYTDDAYWETGTTPRAVQNKGRTKNGTLNGQNLKSQPLTINGASIDLTEQTWRDLGASPSSRDLEWRMADPAKAMEWLRQRRPVA